VPGRPHLVRLGALAAFIVAIAIVLWLADVPPAAVVLLMAAAWALAALVEWLSWQDEQKHVVAEQRRRGARRGAARPHTAPRATSVSRAGTSAGATGAYGPDGDGPEYPPQPVGRGRTEPARPD
jgi:hypothetical protein